MKPRASEVIAKPGNSIKLKSAAVAGKAAVKSGSIEVPEPFLSCYAPSAPLLCPLAPSVLPLKRLCSLSRMETAIANPKFGVYTL